MYKILISILTLIFVCLLFIITTYPDDNLHIVACDVGQGDGILIFQKTTQIIIDGGPGNKMVECLSKYLPFWDRTIEMVILTHPQADHYEGLVEVINRYNVQVFTANSLNASAPNYQLLEVLVGSEGSKVLNPTSGAKFKFGQTEIKILHPSIQWLSENTTMVDGQHVNQTLGATTSNLDPNEFSIIASLQYKNFDAIFTGDTSPIIQEMLLQDGEVEDIEYLKVPHHGSKNGLTKEFLEVTTPEIAVISNGKRNNYGHPHPEILKMLEESNVKVLRTDTRGNVEVMSDGERFWVR